MSLTFSAIAMLSMILGFIMISKGDKRFGNAVFMFGSSMAITNGIWSAWG